MLLAPGLALAIDGVVRRPLVALAPLVVAALWWNHLLMAQYTVGLLPKDEPVSFGRLVQQQADLHTRSPYVYPFAFPANVWFAWREGLPVDKYDLLVARGAARGLRDALRSHRREVPARRLGRAERRRLGLGVVDWPAPRPRWPCR